MIMRRIFFTSVSRRLPVAAASLPSQLQGGGLIAVKGIFHPARFHLLPPRRCLKCEHDPDRNSPKGNSQWDLARAASYLLKAFSVEVLAQEVVNKLENVIGPKGRATMVRSIEFIHHHGFVVLL